MDLPRSRPLVAEKVRRARVWIVEFRVAYRTIVLFREHCESDNPLLEDHQAFVRRTRLLGNPREAPMQSSVEPCGTRQVHDCQSQLPPRRYMYGMCERRTAFGISSRGDNTPSRSTVSQYIARKIVGKEQTTIDDDAMTRYATPNGVCRECTEPK
jgi:hypothetical protein